MKGYQAYLICTFFFLLACGFYAAPRFARSSSLKMGYENEIGALPPAGFWDPLGLSANADAATFNKYRTAELKHGRVAMLAVVGYLVADVARFPGAIDLDGTTFQSIPNGVAALKAVPSFGWFQIAASIGWWEIFGWKQVEGGQPGDFGFDSSNLKWDVSDAEKKTKELQNGRIAMLGNTICFIFIFCEHNITGSILC